MVRFHNRYNYVCKLSTVLTHNRAKCSKKLLECSKNSSKFINSRAKPVASKITRFLHLHLHSCVVDRLCWDKIWRKRVKTKFCFPRSFGYSFAFVLWQTLACTLSIWLNFSPHFYAHNLFFALLHTPVCIPSHAVKNVRVKTDKQLSFVTKCTVVSEPGGQRGHLPLH